MAPNLALSFPRFSPSPACRHDLMPFSWRRQVEANGEAANGSQSHGNTASINSLSVLMQSCKDFKVAIVGGGVCGLTAAVALAKSNVHAHVFEAAPQFGEVGAGVGLGVRLPILILRALSPNVFPGPNAVRILDDIGVLQDVLECCDEPEVNLRSFIFYSGMADHQFIYDYPLQPEDLGLGVHRAHFLGALVKHIDPTKSHHSKRCVQISEDATTHRPVLHFDDGTSFQTDVVLGADGIRSVVRAAVTGEDARKDVLFSNTTCYRGLIPIEDIRAAGVVIDLTQRPVCFVGLDKHLIIFPIKNGAVINVVAFSTDRSVEIGQANRPESEPWVVPATHEQLLEEYEGWGSDVTKILGCIQSSSKWHIHVVHPPLPQYVKGRVALLGDAAHAMLPHLGAGAGQALEDAHLLAKLLAHPQTTSDIIPSVLEAYDHTRRSRAQMVWDRSVMAGNIYEERGDHGPAIEGVREDLHDLWEPVWRHELSADLRKSVAYLIQRGVFR
ncbi:hypothetical protein EIP91_003898 [Steccherinum ochraceum]|uniref:FAD-binding domain-containing protein n=1 Tax=Steccherinum ochraceum TaxID=92696 RepID=A0A4R0R9Q1_9APHY|nr:hypothetical protein EIP91_003898 [Steccherinum ochraceum]